MPSLNLLDAIGNTPLVELQHVIPPGSARVVAKLESTNPTGSMKDRIALALIGRAAADGRLSPGGTVVEYTSRLHTSLTRRRPNPPIPATMAWSP